MAEEIKGLEQAVAFAQRVQDARKHVEEHFLDILARRVYKQWTPVFVASQQVVNVYGDTFAGYPLTVDPTCLSNEIRVLNREEFTILEGMPLQETFKAGSQMINYIGMPL